MFFSRALPQLRQEFLNIGRLLPCSDGGCTAEHDAAGHLSGVRALDAALPSFVPNVFRVCRNSAESLSIVVVAAMRFSV